jgi:6-phosphogluconolactonase
MPDQKNQNVLTYGSQKDIENFLVGKWKEIIEDAYQKRGQATVALSGDRALLGVYNRLADRDSGIDWKRTHLFFTDESFVLSSDPESNYGKVYPIFYKFSVFPDENFHQVPIMGSAEESTVKYQDNIRKFFKLREGEFPNFDIVMMEIGEDGHTASLFPHTDSMTDDANITASVTTANVLLKRITLKPRVFNMARNVFLVATGETKAQVVSDIVSGKNKEYTASVIKPEPGELYYILDLDASSRLYKS